MVNLGMLYQEGFGVPEDAAQANEWFLQAAELGNETAQLNLGINYAEGLGVMQDFDLAEKWWTIAAKQGNKDAEAALKELAIIRAEKNKF